MLAYQPYSMVNAKDIHDEKIMDRHAHNVPTLSCQGCSRCGSGAHCLGDVVTLIPQHHIVVLCGVDLDKYGKHKLYTILSTAFLVDAASLPVQHSQHP